MSQVGISRSEVLGSVRAACSFLALATFSVSGRLFLHFAHTTLGASFVYHMLHVFFDPGPSQLFSRFVFHLACTNHGAKLVGHSLWSVVFVVVVLFLFGDTICDGFLLF